MSDDSRWCSGAQGHQYERCIPPAITPPSIQSLFEATRHPRTWAAEGWYWGSHVFIAGHEDIHFQVCQMTQDGALELKDINMNDVYRLQSLRHRSSHFPRPPDTPEHGLHHEFITGHQDLHFPVCQMGQDGAPELKDIKMNDVYRLQSFRHRSSHCSRPGSILCTYRSNMFTQFVIQLLCSPFNIFSQRD